MTPDEWRAEADDVVADLLAAPWRFGDWCLAADDLDLVDERTDILKADPRFEGTTLAHWAYVAERWPPHRRRPAPWVHHETVARLPEEIQEMLMDLAELEGWTLQELRKAAREAAKDLKT